MTPYLFKTFAIVGILLLLIGCSEDTVSDNDPIIDDEPVEFTVNYPAGPFAAFFDGNLVGADYWSEVPMILSAGMGFADIVGVPEDVLTEELVEQAGGAWLSDIDCDPNDVGAFTSTSLQSQVNLVYVLQTPYGTLEDGAIGLDGLPIVFSWPVLTNTID
ncbi:MAG: hypothetical protein KTR29_09575, partial [Rhodothermaceae bacterium]|nr:hypothetical protein [Rhodothermaceae bacterium]